MRTLLAYALCFFCAAAFAQTKPDICIHLSTDRATLQSQVPELTKSAADAINKRLHLTAVPVLDSGQHASELGCSYRLEMMIEPMNSTSPRPTPTPSSSSPLFQNAPAEQQVPLTIDYGIKNMNAAIKEQKGHYDRLLNLTAGSPLEYDSGPMLRDGINDAAIIAVRKTINKNR